MLRLLIFICLSSCLLSEDCFSQDMQIDSLGYETFEMQEGDTTYMMKKYFMAFLKEGPLRTQDADEAMKIQEGHLAHLGQLAEDGKICIAGPFADDGEIRGIVIFNVPTKREVEELISQDPAVRAGRLILEVHPWWAAQGSELK